MAVAAEKLRFSGVSSVIDNAFLHWLASGGEWIQEQLQVLQRLPDRIAYQFKPDKPRIPQFNVYRLQARWQELLSPSETKESALHKLLLLAKEDFRTYIEEYVLRKNISHFVLKITSHQSNAIITDEYSTPLLTMAHEAVQDFLKQGKPASRMEADAIAIATMMDWAMRGDDGDMAINISPAGGSYLGKDMYSFAFIRTLRVLPNGDREIHTTQHKLWLSHVHLLRLLYHMGAPLPPHIPATELVLTKLFLPLPRMFREEQLLREAQKLPQQHIPEEYKEVVLRYPEMFDQEYQSVEQFFLARVEQAFQHPPTPQTWRMLEEALNFAQRRLLKVVQDDKKGEIQPTPSTRLLQLFETYANHVCGNKKLDAPSAAAVATQLTGILGSLGRVTSMGQCLGGSLFSLNIQGAAGAVSYKGIPLHMLSQEAGGKFHFENCPFCETRMKVFDLPGKIVCSGCGNVKICGAEHGGEHSPTPTPPRTSSHQEVAHQPQKKISLSQSNHEENPIGLSDFIATLLF